MEVIPAGRRVKGRPREEGLLPQKRGAKWSLGVALGIVGVILLFGASTAFTILPRAFTPEVYLSLLGTAFVLILVAYFLVR